MPTNPNDHFKSLFAYAPISLWEEDYSGIKQYFDELRSRGITDLNRYFDTNPADIGKISVLMADLDGLKPVNDKFGYPAGDNLVRRTAEVLKSAFEEDNIVA